MTFRWSHRFFLSLSYTLYNSISCLCTQHIQNTLLPNLYGANCSCFLAVSFATFFSYDMCTIPSYSFPFQYVPNVHLLCMSGSLSKPSFLSDPPCFLPVSSLSYLTAFPLSVSQYILDRVFPGFCGSPSLSRLPYFPRIPPFPIFPFSSQCTLPRFVWVLIVLRRSFTFHSVWVQNIRAISVDIVFIAWFLLFSFKYFTLLIVQLFEYSVLRTTLPMIDKYIT
jgi:hypothetical protein